MKKTINISLGGMSFTIEEDAYARLDSYLNRVKEHFASFPDHEEIVRDIEARIAEQLSVKTGEGRIVTLADIEPIIASMGTPEQFEGVEGQAPHVSSGGDGSGEKARKLFRNPDDAIIAGVASGIAAYFGVDAVWIRLLFFISIFFGGTGVLIYIVLWVVMPEAKTEIEKMQMRGEPINIAGLQQTLKERAEEFKNRDHSKVKHAVSAPLRGIIWFVKGIFRTLFKIISKLIGFILMVAGAFAIAGLLFALVNILFNLNSPYVDFPFAQIAHGWTYYIAVLSAFFLAFVPLLFLMLVGVRVMIKKSVLRASVVFPLIGLWLVAAIAGASTGFRLAPQIQSIVQNDNSHQQQIKEVAATDFTGIDVGDATKVALFQSDTFRVVVSGSQRDIDHTNVSVKDGTLVIRRGDGGPFVCVFCFWHSVTVSVYAPNINSIMVNDASRITATDLKVDTLKIRLNDASRAELGVQVRSLSAALNDASRLTLRGTVADLSIDGADASSVHAEDAAVGDVTIELHDASSAYVGDVQKLVARLEDASHVDYKSAKQLDQHTSDGSRIIQTGN